MLISQHENARATASDGVTCPTPCAPCAPHADPLHRQTTLRVRSSLPAPHTPPVYASNLTPPIGPECAPGRQPFGERVLRGRLLGIFDRNDQRRSREQLKTTLPDRRS